MQVGPFVLPSVANTSWDTLKPNDNKNLASSGRPKLIIDNLPVDCKQDDILELLQNYGVVHSVSKHITGDNARIIAT